MLGPPSEARIVVARAILVQPRAAVEVACSKTPGVRHRPGRTGQIAVGIVRVGGDQCPIAIGQPDNGPQPVEQVIVCTSRSTFVNQGSLGTAAARVVRRAAAIALTADAVEAVDIAGAACLHAVGLVWATVAVIVARDGGGLVQRVVAEGQPARGPA